ncbi:AAA family ATPase [Nocardia sp. NBC_01388]|uniref:AAA family ATPase n=1 Tax=Nocardia sp. NBC_01388 TaxID=2903596 RepID=UPI003252F666
MTAPHASWAAKGPTDREERAIKAFVGRAHELTSLDAVYSAADGPWVFLVEGPAGIGKSRLLGELPKQVGARAVQVVSVPATEFEESTPLQLIRDILDQFPDADTAALDRDPSGADARELARLLRRRLGVAPTSPAPPPRSPPRVRISPRRVHSNCSSKRQPCNDAWRGIRPSAGQGN